MSATAHIGVDVGGTFTDFVLHDPARNLVATGKRLTTPDDPSEAIVAGIARLLEETDLKPGDLHSIVHGTTLVTNTIIERTGCKVGLLTTDGFRDSIEIGREIRYDLYDLFLEAPPTLVPRHLRLEVPERLDVQGNILLPLDEAALIVAARQLVEVEKVEALAIGFLHAWRDPRHERRAAEVICGLYPDLPMTLSSAVAPEIREFERISTACANAYVQPRMQRYLAKLEASLAAMGVTGALYVMLSGGGIASVQEAKDYPIRLIESGPAAGAMAASWLAQRAGLDQVISYDMGGTTAKMCLIQNGAPDRKFDFEAGRVRRFQKGSGLPLKVSVVDMIEIGAGGGSIARVDPASGLMKVGPRSAGAKPGPICYGRGGVEPTVTDSDLVLGRLDPAYFLGGEMALDLPAVTRAVSGDLSAKLGVSADDAALGIRRIVDETMAAATRMHMAEKGRDPRRFTLIAFGGAGPVHACDLARLLKIKRVLVPLGAGVASAIGFLVAPPATDLVRSLVGRLERLDWAKVAALYAEMVAEARGLLLGAGADPADIIYKPAADMRYVGQGFEIPVPMPSLTPGQQDIAAIEESFLAAYRERFGRALDGLPIEALTWRLAASAPGRDIAMEGAQKSESGEARRGTRRALFEGHGWCDCAVYDRYRLAPGTIFAGPALVEERESTCVIPPGAQVSVDKHRNLVIELVQS
jgi:N-methylhydantoinase A